MTEVTEVTLGGQTFGRRKFFAICGPCVLESPELALSVARHLAGLAEKLNIPIIFKASFDKANRTSRQSFRGPGLVEGLALLAQVKRETGLPVLSDIHLPEQAEPAAEVLDVIQIPAFLCRQTDLLLAAARTGKVVNVKKGQFLAPLDILPLVEKLRDAGNHHIWLTERGNSFGYNNLVVDMRVFAMLRSLGLPLIFDATHSVQLPGGKGQSSGGDRRLAAPLAQAALAAGADAVFMEVHPQPDQALCDGPNSVALANLEVLLRRLKDIYALVQPEREAGGL